MFILLLSAHFFKGKTEGWHFYHDPVYSQPEKDQPKTTVELRKQLQEVLDQAIWQPTPRNVLRYMKLQKMLMDKSEQFASTWANVLISHPEFDPTVKHPTSYYGSLHTRAAKEKKNSEQLKKHMKDYALFLVIDDGDMSIALTQVVQDMAKYRGYQITVVNGEDQMHNFVQFGIKRLPVLLMIHVPTGKRSILTYALIGADQIEERMVAVINSHFEIL